MIVGLFPELIGRGRHPALRLPDGAGAGYLSPAQRGERCRFLSLNDAAGARSFKEGSAEIKFRRLRPLEGALRVVGFGTGPAPAYDRGGTASESRAGDGRDEDCWRQGCAAWL